MVHFQHSIRCSFIGVHNMVDTVNIIDILDAMNSVLLCPVAIHVLACPMKQVSIVAMFGIMNKAEIPSILDIQIPLCRSHHSPALQVGTSNVLVLLMQLTDAMEV